jgi:electron transport complex protein RnfD
VLLAFVCPVTIPYWCIIIGDFFAIIVVKQLFGGIGKNIVNPALAARAFMFSWPVLMTNWVKVGFSNAASLFSTADAVTAATPMAAMHQGQLPEETVWDLFLGNVGGCIGETCAVALIIGGVYLIYKHVISWKIPVIYIATVLVLSTLIGRHGVRMPIYELFAGGLMLGAFFMATDMVTSPVTKRGCIIFAVGCGIITSLIRIWGNYPEGVSFSILFMNALVPLIDRWTMPKVFGSEVAK